MNPTKGSIIVFPELEKLKTEIKQLREELVTFVQERDNLLLIECKNIETEYLLKIGALEYKIYEQECEILRLKRKIEMVQARKNRQEKIDLAQIEKALDMEFARYQEKLNQQMQEINQALEKSRGDFLSEEDTKELKKLYRSVVKSLHPDLHPEISEEKIRLFHHAVMAYEMGDLDEMRVIHTLVEKPMDKDDSGQSTSDAYKERERLAGLIQGIQKQMKKIRDQYPYTMKELLQNPEMLAEKKQELQETIEQQQELLERYQTRLREIMG